MDEFETIGGTVSLPPAVRSNLVMLADRSNQNTANIIYNVAVVNYPCDDARGVIVCKGNLGGVVQCVDLSPSISSGPLIGLSGRAANKLTEPEDLNANHHDYRFVPYPSGRDGSVGVSGDVGSSRLVSWVSECNPR